MGVGILRQSSLFTSCRIVKRSRARLILSFAALRCGAALTDEGAELVKTAKPGCRADV